MRKSTAIPSQLPTHPLVQSKKRPLDASLPIGALFTWKEISQYSGRGVRTLQRWEHDFGFPVHRPDPRNKSAVVSLRMEVDEWFRTRPLMWTKPGGSIRPVSCGQAKELTQCAHRLEVEAGRLLNSSKQMNEKLRKAMEKARPKKFA